MGIRNKKRLNFVLGILVFLIPFIILYTQLKIHKNQHIYKKEIAQINNALENDNSFTKNEIASNKEYIGILETSLSKFKDTSIIKSIFFVLLALTGSFYLYKFKYRILSH